MSSDASAGTQPLVVIAVVSWNTRELLDRCLRSLEPSVEAGTAEVWVVDNASTDGSADLVRRHHPWATLVPRHDNLGYGKAINLVAARTASPWFALSNADVALRPGALDALLEAGQRDAEAGVLAPRLLLPDGTTQHSAWGFPSLATTVAQNLGPRLAPRRLAERSAIRGAWDPERGGRVPWAIGAFLLVRREAWDAVGGFDPDQWMSAEDLDLGWRMHNAGWRTTYVPAAHVDHEESAATGSVWGDELPIHWQRCAYAWMVRKLGRRRTIAVGLLNFVGSGVRYLRLLVRLRFRQDAGARALGRWTLVHRFAFAPRSILDRYR